jgi:hypothetical protein
MIPSIGRVAGLEFRTNCFGAVEEGDVRMLGRSAEGELAGDFAIFLDSLNTRTAFLETGASV